MDCSPDLMIAGSVAFNAVLRWRIDADNVVLRWRIDADNVVLKIR